jgi:hypothetical protein
MGHAWTADPRFGLRVCDAAPTTHEGHRPLSDLGEEVGAVQDAAANSLQNLPEAHL